MTGEKIRPMVAVFPVDDPGSRIDDPLKTSTVTSFPSRTASPTSIFSSVGWPIKIDDESFFGVNLTSPWLSAGQLNEHS